MNAEKAPGFALRALAPADIGEVMEIERLSFDSPWTAADFEAVLSGGSHARVAEDAGGRVAGYCVSHCVVDEAEIWTIAVRPDARGAGIGKALLEDALSDARSRGASRMFLEVRSGNAPAEALYLGSGFRKIGIRRGYYRMKDGARADAVVMERSLDDAA